MSRYKVSPELVEGLRPLSAVSSEVLSAFLEIIDKEMPVTIGIEDELEQIAFKSPLFEGLAQEELAGICGAMTGLHFIQATPGLSEEEFLREVQEVWESKHGESEQASALIENSRLVLRSRMLRVSTKAWVLLNDEERLFLSCRILTDVRPIFERDAGSPLLGSVVVHTLKMSMRVDNRSQGFYVSLDSDDLLELRVAIDRALKKAESINDHLRGTSLLPTVGHRPTE